MSVHQSGKRIFGRVFFEEGREAASWILHYYDAGRVCSVVLGIDAPKAVLAAVADAADFLSCRPENIQVSEEGWSSSTAVESDGSQHPPYELARSAAEPRARLYFSDADAGARGWYLQFQSDGELIRQPLWQSDPHKVEEARTEAAWLVGCHPDEIVIGGDVLDWPREDGPHT